MQPNGAVTAPAERPHRPLVRLAILLAYILLLFLFEFAVVAVLGVAIPALRDAVQPAGARAELGSALAGQLLVTGAVLAAVYVARRTLDARSFVSLGFERRQAVPHLVGGAVAGVLLGLVVPVTLLAQGARLVPGVATVASAGAALALIIAAAVGEEVLFRGYGLTNLEEAWGTLPAVGLTTLLFAAYRMLDNPHAGSWAFAGSLALGAALAMVYVAYRSLWLTVSYHAAWNVVSGLLFGLPVSGLPLAGILALHADAAPWLSGGAFGATASILAVALHLLLGAAGIALWKRRAWQAA